MKHNIRIDPADHNGIHIVDIENGGEQVYILKKDIPYVIQELEKVITH